MSPEIRPVEDRRLLGIGLALAGYFCFTIIDSCAKYLSSHGLPTIEVVFVRYAAQLLIVSAIFFPQRGLALTTTRNLPIELIRGLALMGSTIFNFIAITYLPLTITSAIMFTSPLILCAGSSAGW